MVYILHFLTPYKHARHYCGSTPDKRLAKRLKEHRSGQGARLMQVIREAGIEWVIGRTIPGGRERERQIKRTHRVSDYCLVCHPDRKPRM